MKALIKHFISIFKSRRKDSTIKSSKKTLLSNIVLTCQMNYSTAHTIGGQKLIFTIYPW